MSDARETPRPALGYPFRDHPSLAEVWGVAMHGPAMPRLSRAEALRHIDLHLTLAYADSVLGNLLVAEGHFDRADELAEQYGVAWEDATLVRCPLQAREA